jgi:cytochrome P450
LLGLILPTSGSVALLGHGPRQCIGSSFALTEAQPFVATVLQRFHLDLLPGQTVVPEPLVTLRPRSGLPMRIAKA